MPKFIFAYHCQKPVEPPDFSEDIMQKWSRWMNNLGAAVIDPGYPIGKSKTVHHDRVTDDGGANPLEGFTIVEASDINAAIDMAKDCPHLEIGTIEVAPVIDLPMEGHADTA